MRIFDKIAQTTLLFVADWRGQRHRILHKLPDLADSLRRQLHALCQLIRRGLASQFLHHAARSPHQPVDRLHHMHRDTDGPPLIRDRSRDRLTNPPGRIRAELKALPVVKLLHGFNQPQIALLDEIQ